jgi:fimbrial chaperone protein
MSSSAWAGALDITPILLEMNAPESSGTLKLRSSETDSATIQTRVLRWTQRDGVEKLEPTNDVVASPPAVKLAPNEQYVVRVVRVSKEPVVGEESYRVIVDQLPSDPRNGSPAIKLLIRQSIPAFFRAPQLNPGNVAWSLVRKGDLLSLNASNAGDERLRIASLRMQDGSGKIVSFGNGLVGYVLGHSSMHWTLPPHPRDFGHGQITINTMTNVGPVHAVAN